MRLIPLFLAALLVAAEPGDVSKASQAPSRDDPKLPRVMIIGDSISVGYTDEVRQPTGSGRTLNQS